MNFINKIASFVVCVFLAQTPLGFTESHVVHNQNDIQESFEDVMTYWLRAFLKESIQDSIYEDLKEIVSQDELLTMLQDADFQSNLRAHFQKMLEDLTFQEDQIEDKLRLLLQNALQKTVLDELLEDFFTGFQEAFQEEVADSQEFAFFNEMQAVFQDPEFKKDILAVLQDPVIQIALQCNLRDFEFQKAFQNRLQNDELLHAMIQLRFQSVIQEDRLLSIIQNVLQDLRANNFN